MRILARDMALISICAACTLLSMQPVAAQTPSPGSIVQSTLVQPSSSESLPNSGKEAMVPGPIAAASQAKELWVQLASGVAWPVALVMIVLLFAFQPRLNRFLGIAKVVRKIKAAGVEMEINADAIDAVREELRGSVKELIDKARDEYDRMANLMRIKSHMEQVVTKALVSVLAKKGIATNPQNMRSTVHVHDIVFTEYLYQLVDYYPTGEGAGRRFPQRYGIIGRSWRLNQSLGEANAFAAGRGEEETLIEEWGMTRDDARARGKSRPAYLSILLRGVVDDEFPNGILYLDSTAADAFGNENEATKTAVELEKTEQVLALRKALEKMLAPLRLAAPNLEVTQLSE